MRRLMLIVIAALLLVPVCGLAEDLTAPASLHVRGTVNVTTTNFVGWFYVIPFYGTDNKLIDVRKIGTFASEADCEANWQSIQSPFASAPPPPPPPPGTCHQGE